jgi:hypothetical protein
VIPAHRGDLIRIHGRRRQAGHDVDRDAHECEQRPDQHERDSQTERGIRHEPAEAFARAADEQPPNPRQIRHEVDDSQQ